MDPSSTSSSSASQTWVYDVFPSFRGEDVRETFLSHFLKELDKKLIIAFKDNEIERSRSLDPELKQAIKDSRIAVVVFSKNYASSSWCLNELLEIMKCKEEFGQMLIPVFYGLDPSHVRKQTGDFGNIFEKTCHSKTEDEKIQWRGALTNVANILGYHSVTWGNEAKMIEEIVNDILEKLLLTSSKDSDDYVGINDHIKNMSVLLQMESEEVRMVGIWGSSGIGKTTITRILFNRLSPYFQGSIYIDKAFVSKSKKIYSRASLEDHNMKLHLQGKFLSKILGKKDIKVDHLGVLREKLKYHKVLIVIDDLDDLMVLQVLAGQTQWFGSGSRIIVVTNDNHLLMAHEINCIYKVSLPSQKHALEMFCRSAFKQDSPPDGLMKFASEVVQLAGSLPLGLSVLGSSLRGRKKEDCLNMLHRFRRSLDGKIEETLRVGYDGLGKEDQAIFRHIACLFNGVKVNGIKELLANSELDIDVGLQNLVDKSLLHVREDTVNMHRLLEKLGKEIVRRQPNEPAEREFLVDPEDICNVLEDNTGTKKVLGISLKMRKTDELHVHKNAFEGMRNLRFLVIKEGKLHLPKSFDYLPPRLKLLCWYEYPMRHMPTKSCFENLVYLILRHSMLEKLWEGVMSLSCLKKMDLSHCEKLKEIPDLSMATNLEKLFLVDCWSLVELPSSIQNLNELTVLDMGYCRKLEALPTGINLKSLDHLNFNYCSNLSTFPEISTNISVLLLEGTTIEVFPSNLRLGNLVVLRMENIKSHDEKQWETLPPMTSFMPIVSSSLTTLELFNIPSLVWLPFSVQNLNKLEKLKIWYCMGLESLPTGINLKSLDTLSLVGCSRLKNFPDISTNISELHLDKTGIVEVPWWIEKLSRLKWLDMSECINLEILPSRINLQSLSILDLSGCLRLRSFPDISTNISRLDLSRTGIEEVPWWIEKLSHLYSLEMNGCNNLQRVFLNIFKLKHLQRVNFSHCWALVGADLTGLPIGVYTYFPKVNINFFNCFKLDQEALMHQHSVFFKSMILSGEEVSSYFIHCTNGTTSSLTNIPLLHTHLSRPFFRFRACAVVTFDSMHRTHANEVEIHVNCRFKGISGNVFDSFGQPHMFFTTDHQDSHVFILECHIPLNKDSAPLTQLNFNNVDMQLHVTSVNDSKFKLKGWGIRIISEDFSLHENKLCYPNTLPDVCEAEEENMGYTPLQGLVNETEHDEKYGDSNAETERSRKRMRIYYNFI